MRAAPIIAPAVAYAAMLLLPQLRRDCAMPNRPRSCRCVQARCAAVHTQALCS
eukprot:COSAG02_NODE_1401_length_12832_cov_20.599702_11_plen_53_part_00